MKKRLLSLILVVVLSLSISLPCFAVDENSDTSLSTTTDEYGNTISTEFFQLKGNEYKFNYYFNGELTAEYVIVAGSDEIVAIHNGSHAPQTRSGSYKFYASDYINIERKNMDPSMLAAGGVNFGRINYQYSTQAGAELYAILRSDKATVYNDTIDINAEQGELLGDVAAALTSVLLTVWSAATITVPPLGVASFSTAALITLLTNIGALAADNTVKFLVREEMDCQTTDYEISATIQGTRFGESLRTYETTGCTQIVYFEDGSPSEPNYNGVIPSIMSTWSKRALAEDIWDYAIIYPIYNFPGVDSYQRL